MKKQSGQVQWPDSAVASIDVASSDIDGCKTYCYSTRVLHPLHTTRTMLNPQSLSNICEHWEEQFNRSRTYANSHKSLIASAPMSKEQPQFCQSLQGQRGCMLFELVYLTSSHRIGQACGKTTRFATCHHWGNMGLSCDAVLSSWYLYNCVHVMTIANRMDHHMSRWCSAAAARFKVSQYIT